LTNKEKRANININAIAGRYHWHIDLLLRVATDFTTVCVFSENKIECQLIKYLKKCGLKVIIGFGSTDCSSGCGGHLVYLPGKKIEKAKAVIINGFKQLGLEPIVFNTYMKLQS
jgi:Uri superfamily endonuclease